VVCVDHYRQEIREQMSRATASGAVEITINSAEVSAALRAGNSPPNACIDAFREELRPGDIVLDAPAIGMTVKYLLPRDTEGRRAVRLMSCHQVDVRLMHERPHLD
jgi:hypothetical protein